MVSHFQVDATAPDTWPEAVRRALHRRLLHEANEALLVDGQAVFDPHT